MKITVERNVAAKMRDGVTLRADVYRPKAEGKFPVAAGAHTLRQAGDQQLWT